MDFYVLFFFFFFFIKKKSLFLDLSRGLLLLLLFFFFFCMDNTITNTTTNMEPVYSYLRQMQESMVKEPVMGGDLPCPFNHCPIVNTEHYICARCRNPIHLEEPPCYFLKEWAYYCGPVCFGRAREDYLKINYYVERAKRAAEEAKIAAERVQKMLETLVS